MSFGRGDDQPANGGEFLLQLLRKPPNCDSSIPSPPQLPSQILCQDPVVAAVGPTIPTLPPWPRTAVPFNGHDFSFSPWNNTFNSPSFVPHNFFPQNPKQNPSLNHSDIYLPRGGFIYSSHQLNHQLNHISLYVDIKKLRFFGDNYQPSAAHQQEQKSSASRVYEQEKFGNGNMRKEGHNGSYIYRAVALPPRISRNIKDKVSRDHGCSELDNLNDQLVRSLGLEDESDEKSDKKKHHRDKDYRSDKRGQWIVNQRMRNLKSQASCRIDINRLDAPFLAVFELLIPADEVKVKQKQLLTVLEKLVNKEWPEARLYLYGSCANSFNFSKSDIDVCLAIEHENVDKCVVLLKLASLLQSDNFQNVKALTRARVPIVKLMDPVTCISCNICVNNVLAVVNTKLLRDYAQIDVRLQQLVFIVKHWAKSRRVNETYQGTLSSYAYVLMCIHFLQQRRPAILPCLQGMEITYFATVDNVECAYFDQVEKLHNFGARNRESMAQLVWAFFHYWAYCHDYENDVISVRTGSTLSKRAKDWTKRVGNDLHLICIEDPFDVSHDLGRVVDNNSIRVLREEFERAAKIMHSDSNPCATLFEPYIPN